MREIEKVYEIFLLVYYIKIVFKLQLLSLYKANIFREQERPPHRRYDFQTMMQFNIKYGSQNNS